MKKSKKNPDFSQEGIVVLTATMALDFLGAMVAVYNICICMMCQKGFLTQLEKSNV